MEFRPVQLKPAISSTRGGLYVEFRPAPCLRKYIYCYWMSPFVERIAVEPSGVPQSELVLPDGCMDLLFSTDREGNACRSLLVGTMSQGATVHMEHGRIETFGIRFYPGGLQALIQESAELFTDTMASVETLGRSIFTEFGRGLTELNTVDAKINYANSFFAANVRRVILREDQFQNILYRIVSTKGVIRIKDIVESEVISERQMRRIFYYRTGISPKSFIDIIRFQHALSMMNVKAVDTLAGLAADAGYYDESHFIRDFYSYSGMNPSACRSEG